jgi:type I restriction enzyme S subunit
LTPDFRDGAKGATHGLADNWSVRLLSEISEIQGGIQVGKKRVGNIDIVKVPYLRVANVQRGWLNLNEIKVIAVTPEERDRLLLRKGDVLMNEGGDRDKLGRGWVWDGQISECIHQNHVFRIRLHAGVLPPEFVSYFANERGLQYFFDEGTQTTNLASISRRKVGALPVPVPPFDEALEIVRRIETSFSWLDRVTADHASASRLLPKLDAAILSKGANGELVRQDQNDEPASELLMRVKARRSEQSRHRRERTPRGETISEAVMTLAEKLELVLMEAGDWIPAQTAFQRCGIGDGSLTDDIERLYAHLRDMTIAGRLEAHPINDSQGRKIYDRIRLKVV